MMDLKHRTRKPSTPKRVHLRDAETQRSSMLDESLHKGSKAKRRIRNCRSWTMWLGSCVVLVNFMLILVHNAHAQETIKGNVQEAILTVKDAIVETLDQDTIPMGLSNLDTITQEKKQPLYGNLTSALYRFEASKLGPKYLEAVRLFDEYIGQTVDPTGAQFAAKLTQRPGPRQYHKDCFQPPDESTLLNMERVKKMHSPQGIEKMQFLREEQHLFYKLHGHNDSMVTSDRKWAWRTAAVYSAQYAGRQNEFRAKVQKALETPGVYGFFGGLISGTFWYPPNAVREWHTNKWDLSINPQTGEPHMPWRMYYVRQKAATVDGGLDTTRTAEDDPGFFADKSAMHLVEGSGITPDRLQQFGAYPLPAQQGEATVWRIPDQNGYVSLFRLQHSAPYRWHCIVSDDTVHRYSMGMSLDDQGVEEMLRFAGIEL